MIIKLLLAALCAAPASAVAANSSPAADIAAVAAANRRLSARCAREPFGVDELLADAALRADLETCSGDEVPVLIDYAACRTLQGAPGGCSALEGLGRVAKGASAHCLALAADVRFAFLTVRGGDALSACRNSSALEGNRGPSVDKDCAAVIGAVRAGGPKMSCESLLRSKVAASQEACEELRVSWSGEPESCSRYKNEGVRRECSARAALVAGLRDPARCASSPFCQVLVAKSPAACAPLRAQFSRALCARVAKDLAAEPKRLAQEQERRRKAELKAKEKTAKLTAAEDAAAAAVKAKAEAAAAQAKAEAAASQEKVAQSAADQAAKSAEAAAAVKAKADAEAKKVAKAKAAKKEKPQFQKGAPMQTMPAEALAVIKAIEEGRPIPKPKPKKIPKEIEAPAEQ